MKLNLTDDRGNILYEMDTNFEYRFSLETVYGKKNYILKFGFKKENGEVDKTLLTGVQLMGEQTR